jgi:hypothetical protein
MLQMKMSDPNPITTYYSGIPSAEAGTFNIPSTTIRLYCRVSTEPARYMYTLRNVPDILEELLDELGYTMSDIYIESSIDCAHERSQYKVSVRIVCGLGQQTYSLHETTAVKSVRAIQ